MPMSWQVEFTYLKGRFYMYSNDLEEANQCLDFAFTNCHKEAGGNKKRILKFLIPIKMTLGFFPSEALLKKYQLDEYLEISKSCIDGDIAQFNQALQTHYMTFIKSGVAMAVEKLRDLTIRNLIKKLYLTYQKHPELKTDEKGPHMI